MINIIINQLFNNIVFLKGLPTKYFVLFDAM